MAAKVKVKPVSHVVSVRMSEHEYWLLKALAVEKRTRMGSLVLEGVRQVLKQKAQAA